MSKDQILGFAIIMGAFSYLPLSAAWSRINRWWNRDQIQLAKYRHPGSK